MYPLLLNLPYLKVHSYYLLWAFALFIFTFWTRHRAVKNFGMDWHKVTSVIIWVYCAAVIGAYAGNAIQKMLQYSAGGLAFDAVVQGGASSSFGMLFGALAGVYRLKKTGLSVDDFAEASVMPASVMVAAGRIGCFLQGCCTGVGWYFPEPKWWAVHFPFDPVNFYRYPSQLSESAFALMLAAALYVIEKKAPAYGIKIGKSAVLAPVFFVMYGTYRLIFDNLRESELGAAFPGSDLIFALSIIAGIVWGLRTWRVRREKIS